MMATPRFPEPIVPDATWGRRGESPAEWLARSTLPRAVAARQFLNSQLAALPDDLQSVIFVALRSRWQSAFFEMIVARTLQLLGASISAEPEGIDGSRIDFAARFTDLPVNIEAVSPIIDAEAGEAVKLHVPLLDIIETLVPEGWGAMVLELPRLGPNDSKRQFRQEVANMMALLPARSTRSVDFTADLPKGRIHLCLYPGIDGDQRILMEPAITSWNNSEQRIRRAALRKKRQARAANGPSLVAINAGGISSKFEDFDVALFGRTYEQFDPRLGVIGKGFQPDGLFAGRRSEPPILAGVLAFVNVGFRQIPDPVLYLHPRFTENLPESLLILERRYLDPAGEGIGMTPSQHPGVMTGLRFVPNDI